MEKKWVVYIEHKYIEHILNVPDVRKNYPILYIEIFKSTLKYISNYFHLSPKAYEEWRLYIKETKITETNECIKKDYTGIELLERIENVIHKRDNAFDNQEFGATYSQLDDIIEEIREILLLRNDTTLKK